MLWRKPADMKYTDLCKYIDQHGCEIAVAGENPQTEELIYSYLFLLVKALSIKKKMFDNFADYDGYAMYAASRLFMAIRRGFERQGQVFRGKEITPVKNILDYTKALMSPMKLDYLHEQYNITTNANEVNKKFDEFTYKQKLREEVWEQQGNSALFRDSVESLFKRLSSIIDRVLDKAPFVKNSVDYEYAKISILLNCAQNLRQHKLLSAEPTSVIVWKLPKSMGNYIKHFITQVNAELKNEIMLNYSDLTLDDNVINYMFTNPNGEFNSHE